MQLVQQLAQRLPIALLRQLFDFSDLQPLLVSPRAEQSLQGREEHLFQSHTARRVARTRIIISLTRIGATVSLGGRGIGRGIGSCCFKEIGGVQLSQQQMGG